MSEQTQTGSPSAGHLGLLGRKVGMTRIFTAEGESVPVTVLDVSNNRVALAKFSGSSRSVPPRPGSSSRAALFPWDSSAKARRSMSRA
jgi:hypothetical protein